MDGKILTPPYNKIEMLRKVSSTKFNLIHSLVRHSWQLCQKKTWT